MSLGRLYQPNLEGYSSDEKNPLHFNIYWKTIPHAHGYWISRLSTSGTHRVQKPALPPASCVALGKLFEFSVGQVIISMKRTTVASRGVFEEFHEGNAAPPDLTCSLPARTALSARAALTTPGTQRVLPPQGLPWPSSSLTSLDQDLFLRLSQTAVGITRWISTLTTAQDRRSSNSSSTQTPHLKHIYV